MRFAATNRSDSMFLLLPPQFADIRALQDLHHGAQHLQSLSMAEPRGATGFADEPINASDYIMSGIAGVCALACIVAFMAGRRTSANRHRPRTNTANVGARQLREVAGELGIGHEGVHARSCRQQQLSWHLCRYY